MKYTDYLNLKKPEGPDAYSVEDFNANADVLDGKVKAIDEKSADVTREEIACLSGVQSNIQKQFGALGKWLLHTHLSEFFVHPEEHQLPNRDFMYVLYKEPAHLLFFSMYIDRELKADEYGVVGLGQITEAYRPLFDVFGSGICGIETDYISVTLYIDQHGNINVLLPPGHANSSVYGLKASVLYPYGSGQLMLPDQERLEAEEL